MDETNHTGESVSYVTLDPPFNGITAGDPIPFPPAEPNNGDVGLPPAELNEGEVWVRYHPASGKLPEILNSIENPILAPKITVPETLFNRSPPPWHPFSCRADFEQAELFVRFDVSDPQINAQLKLVTSVGSGITIKSAKELHKILAQIPTSEILPEVNFHRYFFLMNRWFIDLIFAVPNFTF
jgi:hypothetical protein